MKPSIAILYILVALSLVVSLSTLMIVAGDKFLAPSISANSLSVNPTIPTPKPTSNSAIDGVTFSYLVSSQNQQEHAFTVNIEYQGKNQITINYSQFYLQLSAGRMIYTVYEGSARPQNNGTLTLEPSHPTETIQLIFDYPSTYFNGMDSVPMNYELHLCR